MSQHHNGFGDGRDLVKTAEKKGGEVRYCKSDHCVVSNGRGAAVIPLRPMGKGIFLKCKKELTLLGLAAFVGLCALVANIPVLAEALQ